MTGLPLPPVPEPYHLPFHYGALHNIGVDYLVRPDRARELLGKRHPGLTAAVFDGGACLSLNYQLYFAQYPNGGGITEELEINLVAHPVFAEDRLPVLNYGQYARGYDQTKLLGIARLHVLCDNPLAIDAGRRLYAEPKHPSWFETALPSLNAPAVRERWSVSCRRATLGPDGLRRHDEQLLSLDVDLIGLTPESVNNTPITGYGTDDEGKLLAGPLNVYQPYRYYSLDDRTADRVRLDLGNPAEESARDLAHLIADAPAAGVWTYQSPPVAAHNRAYYVR
ncbi:hypothetical protein P3T27_005774 [Kitasatospora sp. MAA19]|uniref:hypothetical protein n=1 Tax=Kitasatospora sp. MAA19 TaxID=3035090 RepID=UPI00247395AF|nr:hypothetical protein [Kitasatospora sp. MAA19]MDH6709028.1 hypothetical protein [Kitasatospora sp. MAA19]